MDESTLRYTATHEWVHVEGDVCTVGISRFAVDQLTDIVYVELPSAGAKVTAGGSFGVIESVKAVSDLYSPVTGEVVEVNDKLTEDPALLNEDPYASGWMIKVRLSEGLDESKLMDKAAYDAHAASEAH